MPKKNTGRRNGTGDRVVWQECVLRLALKNQVLRNLGELKQRILSHQPEESLEYGTFFVFHRTLERSRCRGGIIRISLSFYSLRERIPSQKSSFAGFPVLLSLVSKLLYLASLQEAFFLTAKPPNRQRSTTKYASTVGLSFGASY
ncbi:hypothetical protein V6N12_010081 [Hibiscus sabdariffa]|uniref:Uncharacterized protein n=1 Tax=Hibiscus sabdariffa TaxID=183260 RepID=A0ABR2ECM9_9ROSI